MMHVLCFFVTNDENDGVDSDCKWQDANYCYTRKYVEVTVCKQVLRHRQWKVIDGWINQPLLDYKHIQRLGCANGVYRHPAGSGNKRVSNSKTLPSYITESSTLIPTVCLLEESLPHVSLQAFSFNQPNTPLSNPWFHCDPLWQVHLSAAEGIYLSAVSSHALPHTCVCESLAASFLWWIGSFFGFKS